MLAPKNEAFKEIYKVMKKRKLSYNNLADMLGISKVYIYTLIKKENININFLKKVCKVLKLRLIIKVEDNE